MDRERREWEFIGMTVEWLENKKESGSTGICSHFIEPPTVSLEPRFPLNEECGLEQDQREGDEDDPLNADKARAYALIFHVFNLKDEVLKP